MGVKRAIIFPNSIVFPRWGVLLFQNNRGGEDSAKPEVSFYESLSKVALQTWKWLCTLPLQTGPADRCNLFCHSSGVYVCVHVCVRAAVHASIFTVYMIAVCSCLYSVGMNLFLCVSVCMFNNILCFLLYI